MRTHRPRQTEFQYRTHGGARAGAGRPKDPEAGVSHEARPALAQRFPVQVTLRARPGVPNLRRGEAWACVEAALRAIKGRPGFRVVHFSAQPNHLHLLVEAPSAEALSRGVQGLSIRMARWINRTAGHRGEVWADRYHARVLRTPRATRNALCYVLQNSRRHASMTDGIIDPEWIDPRSSGRWFDGWCGERAAGWAARRGAAAFSLRSGCLELALAAVSSWARRHLGALVMVRAG